MNIDANLLFQHS